MFLNDKKTMLVIKSIKKKKVSNMETLSIVFPITVVYAFFIKKRRRNP
jgi:hypothetical protein